MFSFIFLLVMTAVTFVLSEVLRPKPNIQNAAQAHLGDFQFPTATQGRVVPVIWGTVKLNGPNVVWYGNLKPKPITVKVKTGMFSSKKQTTGYKYYVGMDMALCRGQIDAVTKIWIGDKVAWQGSVQDGNIFINQPKLLGGLTSGQGGVVGTLKLFSGTITQIADPYLAQSPENFLWFDDFAQGNLDQGLHRFQNSTPGIYYWVSNKGATTNFGPGSLVSDASPIKTGPGTVGSTATHIFNEETNTGPTGDTDVYTAVLQHPDRTRLVDKIKVFLTFRPPSFTTATAPTTGNTRLGMGCRVQDLPPFTNNYGIFLTVLDTDQIDIWLSTPTTGGSTNILSLTQPGSFSRMSAATHTVEMHVDGLTITVLLDGAVLALVSDGRIVEIPGDNQGFSLIYSGNTNTNFHSPTSDWTNLGIYNFGIDMLGRPITNDMPAYRGVSHGVWEGGYLGTSTQISPWSFEARRCPNGLGLPANQALINNADANPMNVLYEILTDPDWGLGFQSSDIDLTNFAAAAATLATEGNGFSGILDTTKQGTDLEKIVTQQIDGLMFINRTTGLWQVKLARSDYSLGSCPVLNETNVLNVKSFSRGAWAETTNNMRISIVNRDNEYQPDYGIAQDMANIRIQGGTVITSEQQYTGVKNKTLANNIAWRDLRMLSYPIAKAQVEADRTMAGLNPGDVVSWSDVKLSLVNMAMRISRIDLGKLEEGIVTLDMVQDVFSFMAPSYADPQTTSWQLPTTPQSALPKDPFDRYIMEAPLALCRLAEVNPGAVHRIWAGARDPGDTSNRFEIWAADGANAYADSGGVEGFLTAGQLHAALDPTGVQGSVSIIVDATPDVAADIILNSTNASPLDIGTKLFNICVIDHEFIAFQTVVDNLNGTVTLGGCYRGMMDTAPASHAINTRVWFLCAAGNLTDNSFTPLNHVGVKLLTEGLNGSLDIGLASSTDVHMNYRAFRPYPPVAMKVNNVLWASTANIDTSGLTIDFVRRDFRNTNEVAAVVDESSLPSDFPAANNTVYRLQLYNDPAGINHLAYTSPWVAGGAGVLTLDKTAIIRHATESLYTALPTQVKNYSFSFGGGSSLPSDFTVYWVGTGLATDNVAVQAEPFAMLQTNDGLAKPTLSTPGTISAAYLTAVPTPPAKRSIQAFVRLSASTSLATIPDDEDPFQFMILDRLDMGGLSGDCVAIVVAYQAGSAPNNDINCAVWSVTGQTISGHANNSWFDYADGSLSPYIDVFVEVVVDDATDLYQVYINGVLLIETTFNAHHGNTGVGFQWYGHDFSGGTARPWYATSGVGDPDTLNGIFAFGLYDATGGTGHIETSTTLTFPTRLNAVVQTQHYYGRESILGTLVTPGTLYSSQDDLNWAFNISSTDSALFHFGLLIAGQASRNYTAASTGTFRLTLQTALPTGAVQVSVNGGAYTTVIAATATTGTFSATTGQTIAVKHGETGITPTQTLLTLTDPATNGQAFAVLAY